jgi:NTP pyrophosphatase (non-canonical NTP hydrolase)
MKEKRYYVYHIFGKKIGMTSNVQRRVVEEQGYAETEYEILLSSASMEIASNYEKKFQKQYGYPEDRQTYKQLMKLNDMKNEQKINVTNQTITFPCPLHNLKRYITRMMPLSIDVEGKPVEINLDNIEEVIVNAKVSMYNPERTYIYNNKLVQIAGTGSNDFMSMAVNEPSYAYDYQPPGVTATCNKCIFPKIREWAKERGIFDKGDAKTQYVKLMEEAGEVARAILKNDTSEIKDGIGDMVVVLTNLAHLSGLTIEECIESAYDVISKRKGAMVNGSFVKNETL